MKKVNRNESLVTLQEMDDCGLPPNRRAHHNALERERRSQIKTSFAEVRERVPGLEEAKVRNTFLKHRFLFICK